MPGRPGSGVSMVGIGVVPLCLALVRPAGAFTLEPAVHLTDAMDLDHLDAAGDTVTVAYTGNGDPFGSWDPPPHHIRSLVSHDRGATWVRDEVAEFEPSLDQHRTLYAGRRAAIAASADGASRVVLSSFVVEDDRLPPFDVDGWGDPIPVQFWGIGTWRDDGAAWRPAHTIDAMTNRCDAGGRRCRMLGTLALAVDDDASVGWAASYYDVPGPNGPPAVASSMLITRVERGVPVGSPIDVTGVVGDHVSFTEAPHVLTDASGGRLVLAWLQGDAFVAVTPDGGASWSTTAVAGAPTCDVDLARDSGAVVWATMDTGLRQVQLRTSADGGVTFGPPAVVDQEQAELFDFSHVRVATSRDGATVAVVYGEQVVGGYAGQDDVVLSVSEDGGATWTRVGDVGRVDNVGGFDVAMAPDGDAIYVISREGRNWEDGTTFVRAVR